MYIYLLGIVSGVFIYVAGTHLLKYTSMVLKERKADEAERVEQRLEKMVIRLVNKNKS